jgi:hypothetical protein
MALAGPEGTSRHAPRSSTGREDLMAVSQAIIRIVLSSIGILHPSAFQGKPPAASA